MDVLKKYWGIITAAFGIVGLLIGYYNDAHTWIYDRVRGDIHEQEFVKPKLDKILSHADSIGYYRTEFVNLIIEVHLLKMENQRIKFQATQAMKQIYYYVMVYDPVLDQHGCKYHLRRFPDDGTPESISRRDYWKLIDDVIYLVETSNEGAYYNDYLNNRVNLKHKWSDN